jgi:hypothetical protein
MFWPTSGLSRFQLLVPFTVVPVLALLSGCMAPAPAAAPPTAPAVIQAERAKALAAEQRVAELEKRLAALESASKARTAAPRSSLEPAAVSDKLDRLIAAQEQLVERMAQQQAGSPVSARPPAPHAAAAANEALCRPSAELVGFEARLHDLVQRAQADLPPWRGGLSREKREALRLLLREDRQLDGKNPLEL